ncbi:unnamed protein product [Penicillium nalgiovense]|nr:unnamed protein product [Penicillium nalgiovense]CAG8168052.1 unnamed protein product [Penicillium nalgiovense]
MPTDSQQLPITFTRFCPTGSSTITPSAWEYLWIRLSCACDLFARRKNTVLLSLITYFSIGQNNYPVLCRLVILERLKAGGSLHTL